MPINRYICTACDAKLEVFQKPTEGWKKKCPTCKKYKLRKVFNISCRDGKKSVEWINQAARGGDEHGKVKTHS